MGDVHDDGDLMSGFGSFGGFGSLAGAAAMRKREKTPKAKRGDDKLNMGPIRPSDVRSTERDLRDGQIHFYNSGERTTKTWLGWRPYDEWSKISEHMKKSMHPDCSDMTIGVIFWEPKEE